MSKSIRIPFVVSGHKLTAVVHREIDQFVAICPEIGTASQGDSQDDSVRNLEEATCLYLEEFPLEK